MKTLNIYVARQLISVFIVSLMVMTFIMLAAGIVAGAGLLAKGLSVPLFFKFIGYGMPKAMGLAIPMSILTATILVFGRLSADNEITAMRSSGISIWQIVSPCLLFSIVISALCMWLQLEIIPHSNYMVRQIKKSGAAINPRIMLEPGRPIMIFDGLIIYLDDIKDVGPNENELHEVHIYQLNDEQKTVKEFIASKGTLLHEADQKQFILKLDNANIIVRGKDRTDRLKGSSTFPLAYGDRMASERVSKKDKSLRKDDIFAKIKIFQENGLETMPLYVELHKRLALALCPFAFLLLGIPFGIRTSRTETSVGLVVSIALALLFYIFIIIADNTQNRPELRPDFLIWIPNIIYQIGGLIALKRISRR